jgi:nicotinamide riboside kinase
MKHPLFAIVAALLICLDPSCLYCGQSQRGLLITAVGLPSSGTSSVMRELAKLIDGTCFCEPETGRECPDAVKCRELSGNFTMISWFRSVRLPQLFRANQVRSCGEIAILDSYYDKLLIQYIGKPGMEWLISPSDPYFDVTVAMAKRDWEELPNVDVIIFFEVSFDLWKDFLAKQNGWLDTDQRFLESFATQDLILKACQRLANEKNITLIKIKQEWSSPKDIAIKVRDVLYEKKILHSK